MPIVFCFRRRLGCSRIDRVKRLNSLSVSLMYWTCSRSLNTAESQSSNCCWSQVRASVPPNIHRSRGSDALSVNWDVMSSRCCGLERWVSFLHGSK
ncbi:hypothetical protein AVEN_191083-1 [Araneus ventricosus]|uniref:Uncharacterized protein n=1 Tax=Araneus ventricosus TaxID=182803 RepID=A0A4Y2AX32_ARAVE|nr:hypothetical protein AVEN_191083-1 [Araneus ventricosus]